MIICYKAVLYVRELYKGILFADVRGIVNKKTVVEGHENVQAALLDYTLTCYPSVNVSKLNRLKIRQKRFY